MIRKSDIKDTEIIAALAIKMWPAPDPDGSAEEFPHTQTVDALIWTSFRNQYQASETL